MANCVTAIYEDATGQDGISYNTVPWARVDELGIDKPLVMLRIQHDQGGLTNEIEVGDHDMISGRYVPNHGLIVWQTDVTPAETKRHTFRLDETQAVGVTLEAALNKIHESAAQFSLEHHGYANPAHNNRITAARAITLPSTCP